MSWKECCSLGLERQIGLGGAEAEGGALQRRYGTKYESKNGDSEKKSMGHTCKSPERQPEDRGPYC